jgi:K+-transporting ATPase KdpF subunit
MSLEHVIGLVVTLALCAYLVYALVAAERM